MSFSLRATFALTLLTFGPLGFARAETPEAFAERTYKDMEGQIRKELDTALGFARTERERKIKSGEPLLSAREERDAMEGIKDTFYNRAVIHALCAEDSFRNATTYEQASALLSKCVEAKLFEMAKFMKMSEYYSSVGKKKAAFCEMRSRDYKNEFRFQPYEFLRSRAANHLFDFKAFNECILSGVDD